MAKRNYTNKPVEKAFNAEALAKSDEFSGMIDIISVLFKPDDRVTRTEMREAINKFRGRKVN